MSKGLLKPFSVLALSLIIFTGCGMLPYRNDFQCEKGKNSGVCAPVSSVYDMSSDMDDLRLRTLDGMSEEEVQKQQNEERAKQLAAAKDAFKTQKLQEMVEAYEIQDILNQHPTIFNFYMQDPKKKNPKDSYLASMDMKKAKNTGTKGSKKKNSNAGKKNANAGKKSGSGAKSGAGAGKDNNVTADGLAEYQRKYIADVEANRTKQGIGNGLDNNGSLAGGKDLNASNNGESLEDMLNKAYAQGRDSVECAAGNGKRTDINAKVRVCVYAANIRKEPSCKAKVLRIAYEGEEFFALYEQDGWVKLNDGTYIHKSIITQD